MFESKLPLFYHCNNDPMNTTQKYTVVDYRSCI